MVKRIIIVTVAIALLFALSFFTHNTLLDANIRFSLLSVYAFHVIAVILIYAVIEFAAEHIPTQAGYTYLMLMCFKLGFFLLLFQGSIFSEVGLTQAEKVGLVVPFLVFLSAEAAAVAKLLNSK